MFSLISGCWGKDAAKEGNVWAAGEERRHEDVGEGMRKSNKAGGGTQLKIHCVQGRVLWGGGIDLKT